MKLWKLGWSKKSRLLEVVRDRNFVEYSILYKDYPPISLCGFESKEIDIFRGSVYRLYRADVDGHEAGLLGGKIYEVMYFVGKQLAKMHGADVVNIEPNKRTTGKGKDTYPKPIQLYPRKK